MSQMSRVMIVLMAATCVSGAVWAQGKSGSSHGGGAPASVPATGSAPASPPSGGATGGGAPSMPSSTTSTIPAPTTGVNLAGTSATADGKWLAGGAVADAATAGCNGGLRQGRTARSKTG